MSQTSLSSPMIQTAHSDPSGTTLRKPLFGLGIVLVLGSYWIPQISPPLALALGLVFALTGEHPYRTQSTQAMKWLLQASVVGLGFGMNIMSVIKAGQTGFFFTLASILGTLGIGMMLGKLLGVRKGASQLISVGTAICGGSAIAAVAPVIKAEEAEISVALGTVFVLNALALFIFPPLGAALGLTQEQFGIWAAIAIHDTSSVVGAASKYGAEALSIATTVKLSRALWIIPITLGAALLLHRNHRQGAQENSPKTKIQIPYFIGFFVLASLVNTFLPGASVLGLWLVPLAKTGLTLTLFLIGTGLSRTMLASVGVKPLVQGVVLWIGISVAALWAVRSFV
ncbi:MAG: putative sulfate exporter family transporter [Candidatus Kapabacteria bacterium]|jgi:uncharacterized integral membrane protein (TIGR00698 family)|nr:putative sulfate exporter family transporter [Candidatus Kapabacteria bacterium]